MSASPDRSIRKFNPGTFQSDEEVSRQFVVRRHELGIVLEVLRENIDSPSCQHALFEYRFNRRFDLPDMIPRLVHVALRTPPMLERMPERLLKLNLARVVIKSMNMLSCIQAADMLSSMQAVAGGRS